VREFHRALTELQHTHGRRRTELSRQLREVEADIVKIVDLLVKGTPSRALTKRLSDLESKRDATEADIAEAAPPPIKIHSDAAQIYRAKISNLKAALREADEDNRNEAYRVIRELVQKIIIRTAGPYKTIEIDIYGCLGDLLGTPPPNSMGVLVAGVGFEPTTFRL
jgi:hypothetical protein